jgi:hypothetical protein
MLAPCEGQAGQHTYHLLCVEVGRRHHRDQVHVGALAQRDDVVVGAGNVMLHNAHRD